MGSLCFENSKNRFHIALDQRLAECDDAEDREAVYKDAVQLLLDIAMDDEEVNRVAREFAVAPDEIEFPE